MQLVIINIEPMFSATKIILPAIANQMELCKERGWAIIAVTTEGRAYEIIEILADHLLLKKQDSAFDVIVSLLDPKQLTLVSGVNRDSCVAETVKDLKDAGYIVRQGITADWNDYSC